MAVTKVPYDDTTAMGVYLKRGPAPSGGAVFSLQIKAGQPACVTFPPTVSLSEGEQDKQFDVTWALAGTTIIQAQLTEYGGVARTGDVYESNVEALAGEEPELVVLLPPLGVIEEGLAGKMLVALSREATAPTVVTLESSNPAVGTVPASVTVETGLVYGLFDFTALSVGSAVVTASLGVIDKQADVNVLAIQITSVAPSAIDVLVEDTFLAWVVFEENVIRDETVALQSSDEQIATVPASVVVPNGSIAASFDVTALRVGSVVITATHSTGEKQSEMDIVPRGYGPATCDYKPRPVDALEHVPRPLGAERKYD